MSYPPNRQNSPRHSPPPQDVENFHLQAASQLPNLRNIFPTIPILTLLHYIKNNDYNISDAAVALTNLDSKPPSEWIPPLSFLNFIQSTIYSKLIDRIDIDYNTRGFNKDNDPLFDPMSDKSDKTPTTMTSAISQPVNDFILHSSPQTVPLVQKNPKRSSSIIDLTNDDTNFWASFSNPDSTLAQTDAVILPDQNPQTIDDLEDFFASFLSSDFQSDKSTASKRSLHPNADFSSAQTHKKARYDMDDSVTKITPSMPVTDSPTDNLSNYAEKGALDINEHFLNNDSEKLPNMRVPPHITCLTDICTEFSTIPSTLLQEYYTKFRYDIAQTYEWLMVWAEIDPTVSQPGVGADIATAMLKNNPRYAEEFTDHRVDSNNLNNCRHHDNIQYQIPPIFIPSGTFSNNGEKGKKEEKKINDTFNHDEHDNDVYKEIAKLRTAEIQTYTSIHCPSTQSSAIHPIQKTSGRCPIRGEWVLLNGEKIYTDADGLPVAITQPSKANTSKYEDRDWILDFTPKKQYFSKEQLISAFAPGKSNIPSNQVILEAVLWRYIWGEDIARPGNTRISHNKYLNHDQSTLGCEFTWNIDPDMLHVDPDRLRAVSCWLTDKLEKISNMMSQVSAMQALPFRESHQIITTQSYWIQAWLSIVEFHKSNHANTIDQYDTKHSTNKEAIMVSLEIDLHGQPLKAAKHLAQFFITMFTKRAHFVSFARHYNISSKLGRKAYTLKDMTSDPARQSVPFDCFEDVMKADAKAYLNSGPNYHGIIEILPKHDKCNEIAFITGRGVHSGDRGGQLTNVIREILLSNKKQFKVHVGYITFKND